MSLRIGILGAAKVAIYAMIAPAKDVEGVVVQAVAARDPERAKAYAAEHGIPMVYLDYQALIEADDVDAVYVALPPNLHAKWSIAALKAGKPVLCEKPFALSSADVEAMLATEAETDLLLMEAQHSHYHPLSARMREVVAGGQLGRIESVETAFDVPVSKAEGEIRYDPAVGGGAIWDLGIYPLHWARSALNEDLRLVSSSQRLAASGADVETKAELISASGIKVSLSANMDAPLRAFIRFIGTQGRLMIDRPIAPQHGHQFLFSSEWEEWEEKFPTRTTYAYQLEAFRDAIISGASVPTRGTVSLAEISLLEQICAQAIKE
jgi:predicted dehydrogenase